MKIFAPYITVIFALLFPFSSYSQERVGHIDHNPFLTKKSIANNFLARKTTTATTPLNLPFFEDFTGYQSYPDSSRWTDFEVYVNNTMGLNPITRGVATFDGLDKYGIPYDSFSNVNYRYADSLTSQPINLDPAIVAPGDSVYFSFFYQAQGNAYYPENGDSLMLYFKTKYGGYIKVWSLDGSDSLQPVRPFKQVMIPIADSLFFDSFFQFRFVNKAAMQWADADWHVDYIRLDRNRSQADTAIADLGFASDPSFLLNDYTSMPYRQFMASPAGYRSSHYFATVHNNYGLSQPFTYGYHAIAMNNGAVLRTDTTYNASIIGHSLLDIDFLSYANTIPMPGLNTKVVFENTYYIESVSPSDSKGNDTVVKDMVFDNYLAYDDGTAEKSYYLDLFPTLPGKIAIEYYLNQPDTMRGMSIYFGRQIPFAAYKSFNINVYSAIGGINGAPNDMLLYTQELYTPCYVDSINHFWNYIFDVPLVLPAGLFYSGTTQPAEGNNDSLYFGLDVNRIGSNHVYYKVLSNWYPSSISGAIMMRPLLGQLVLPTAISDVNSKSSILNISPNPATDEVQLDFAGDGEATYMISDLSGRTLLTGTTTTGTKINIANLTRGMYVVTLCLQGINWPPQKVIKL